MLNAESASRLVSVGGAKKQAGICTAGEITSAYLKILKHKKSPNKNGYETGTQSRKGTPWRHGNGRSMQTVTQEPLRGEIRSFAKGFVLGALIKIF